MNTNTWIEPTVLPCGDVYQFSQEISLPQRRADVREGERVKRLTLTCPYDADLIEDLRGIKAARYWEKETKTMVIRVNDRNALDFVHFLARWRFRVTAEAVRLLRLHCAETLLLDRPDEEPPYGGVQFEDVEAYAEALEAA